MRVLVVGSGGREHAIVTHLTRRTPDVEIFSAPGNPGIGAMASLADVAPTDASGLARLAVDKQIGVAIVGPEAALAAGAADALREVGVHVLGPGRVGARVETSKLWAKELMVEAGIPTARFQRFTRSNEAIRHCANHSYPLVVKADGLAAGKGAVVCGSFEEARNAIVDILERRVFGDAGREILIEDFLTGEEFTLMVFTDGLTWRSMPISQDHKRVLDNDEGLNTGGMGAYTPVPTLPQAHDESIEKIFIPLLHALAQRDIPYRGVLCGNLIWTADGPYVLEFNGRFGDPEAEVTLPLLETDLAAITVAIETGSLDDVEFEWSAKSAVCVAMTATGYPSSPNTGDQIMGLDQSVDNTYVFHAGTRVSGDHVVTNGGRVLMIVGTGDDLLSARRTCYERVAQIEFDGMHYRSDIGWRAERHLGCRDRMAALGTP